MANYPKGGFIDHGQEIQVARGANIRCEATELSVAWFSVAPKAKDAVGILSQKPSRPGRRSSRLRLSLMLRGSW